MTGANLSLTHYATKLYDTAAVAHISLQLQDIFGLDVNILLTLCWLAERNIAITDQLNIDDLVKTTAPIREDIIKPLRRLRRRLKGTASQTVYEAVKKAELAAEFEGLAMLQKAANAMRLKVSSKADKRTLALNSLKLYINDAGAHVLIEKLSETAFPE